MGNRLLPTSLAHFAGGFNHDKGQFIDIDQAKVSVPRGLQDTGNLGIYRGLRIPSQRGREGASFRQFGKGNPPASPRYKQACLLLVGTLWGRLPRRLSESLYSPANPMGGELQTPVKHKWLNNPGLVAEAAILLGRIFHRSRRNRGFRLLGGFQSQCGLHQRIALAWQGTAF